MEKSDKLIDTLLLPVAAKILECDARALLGFIDDVYGDEVEDDPELRPQMDNLCKLAEEYLDPKNGELFEKVAKVMEMIPGFKEKVDEIVLTNCAWEVRGQGSFLTPEAFKIAMESIKKDPDLQKRFAEEAEGEELLMSYRELAKSLDSEEVSKRVVEIIDAEVDDHGE